MSDLVLYTIWLVILWVQVLTEMILEYEFLHISFITSLLTQQFSGQNDIQTS